MKPTTPHTGGRPALRVVRGSAGASTSASGETSGSARVVRIGAVDHVVAACACGALSIPHPLVDIDSGIQTSELIALKAAKVLAGYMAATCGTADEDRACRAQRLGRRPTLTLHRAN